VQKQIAVWNTELKLWSKPQMGLLSEHLELYSATWPTSGMTVNGVAYELPIQVPPTSVSESLLLRTPIAGEAAGGAVAPEVAKARNQTLRLSGQMIDMVAPNQLPKLLPTPVTTDGKSVDVANQVATRNSLQLQSITAILGMPQDTWMKTDLSGNKDRQVGEAAKRRAANLATPTVSDQYTGNLASTQQKPGSMHSVTLAQVFHKPDLFPTPNTMEHLPARTGEARERQLYRGGSTSRRNSSGNLREDILDLIPTPTTRDYKDGSQPHERDGKVQTDTVARAVFNSGEVLLGTPRANAANSSSKQVEAGAPKARIEDQVLTTNWGKFEPAIRRWEAIIGRPAPEPTKPDGKDGNHRLSSKFTEWMMGLPDGWITGHDLKRNDELKLAGNGVVPQQAELALRLLLDLPGEKEN
jgi:hypothetical protein